MRLIVVVTIMTSMGLFSWYALESFGRIAKMHVPSEARERKFDTLQHPGKKWVKIKYRCPRLVYPGTAKVAESGSHPEYTVCCYSNGTAKVVDGIAFCWVKHD